MIDEEVARMLQSALREEVNVPLLPNSAYSAFHQDALVLRQVEEEPPSKDVSF